MLIALSMVTLLVQASLPEGQNVQSSVTPQALTQTATRAGTNIDTPMTPEEEAQPERVCRMEPVTGSRFPVRVCRTPRNSAANRNESQDMLRRMQGLPDLPADVNRMKTIPGF